MRVDQNVFANLIPYRRCARLHGFFRKRYARQQLILDDHCFQCVEGLYQSFSNNHRNCLADMPCFVGRQKQMRSEKYFTASGTAQFHVVFRFRKRVVRNWI